MDSIFEDSPLAKWLRLWDNAETLLLKSPQFLLYTVATALYLVLRGDVRNVVLVAGIFCWKQHAELYTLIHNLHALKYLVLMAGSPIVFRSLLRHSRSFFLERGGSSVEQAQPCLITGKTTHRRLFPQKHSFSYSYLLVGIPVGIRGNYQDMISIDCPTNSGLFSTGKAWYDVNAGDYLSRGAHELGLRGKLDTFLKSQVRPSWSGRLYVC